MTTFLRGAAAILAVATTPAWAAAPLAGHWTGVFDVAGAPTYVQGRFSGADAQLKGAFDLPLQEKKDLALQTMTAAKGGVQFALPGPDGLLQFDGKLRGDTVSGKVSNGGKQGSFTLHRTVAPSPARDSAYYGAYRFPGQRIVVLHGVGEFPQLYYTDLQSGRVAAMYATGEAEYFSGAGLLNPSRRETRMHFERAASGAVTGLRWQQQGEKPQSGQRLDLRSEEVSFANGPVKLSGTLVLPEGQGPFPAVVLTQTSSMAPRDAYTLQAYYFASHGIAALMYDKRGVGKSTGEARGSMEDFADDAVAGVALLAARKDIDGARIGTWGHSQGGWLAPLAAVRSDKVAFVIAQSASAVTPAEQEVFRIEHSLRAAGLTPADVQAAVDYERLLMRWVTTGGAGRDELLAAVRASTGARWANEVEIMDDALPAKPRETSTKFFGYEPLPALQRLRVPLLIILGDRDNFVPVQRSEQLFRATLTEAGHKDFQVWMLPRAAHGLWETDVDSAAALVNSRYWARGHYPRMTQWLREHGFARAE